MAAIDSQTSSADEVTISTKTRSNEELTTRIRIQTIHDECYGLVDPEGEPPIGIAPQQIDENLRCGKSRIAPAAILDPTEKGTSFEASVSVPDVKLTYSRDSGPAGRPRTTFRDHHGGAP